VATGCGSSDETFTSGEADRALAALDATQEYVDDGRCTAAARRVRALATQSTHINSDRPELGEAWAGSVARLQTLVARECVEITETTPTEPTTAATGPTEKPTPEPEPTEPTDVTPVEPDNGNGNNGNGDNNGGTPNDNQQDTPPEDTGGAGLQP
jgi:hypothetical protein